jgi:urease accessory protein
MRTVNKCLPQGAGVAKVLLKRAATITLDWDQRQKSRLDTTASDGSHVGIFLARGTLMRGGDVLVVDDGGLLLVQAAPQPVMEVRPCAVHGHAQDLIRAAYHLGNRHVAVDVQADHLKLEPDHVLADMLRGMHFEVTNAQAAFEPEGGAYQSHGDHGHHGHQHDDHAHTHEAAHTHSHSDAHTHTHTQAVAPSQAVHAKPHVHTAACKHGDHAHEAPQEAVVTFARTAKPPAR